mmetsp:Transcript_5730/g.6487  ORF Transcript_5730/g.6487 Transcript_5730/m.6487 type:complete len:95 (+) Transcript_5730:87-371(+)
MAEQKQVQQPQMALPVVMEAVEQPQMGRTQQLVGQPVRVQHEIGAGPSSQTKPDSGEWCCIVSGYGPMFLVVGFLIWMLWRLSDCSAGFDCMFD